MQLRATRDGDGWRLNGQKTWTTSAHFAEWYWLGARTDPDSKHNGITLFLVELDQPGHHRSSRSGRWVTSGPTRSTWTTCGSRTTTWSGEVNHGFQYISEALDLERFTLFTYSPIQQRLDLLRLRGDDRARR
jgi:alkylation response protein AidB-like acyl-CoA dehydrogenase